jgi:hypothetical protein
VIWQQLTVDADAIATTEDVDAVITTVVILSGLSFFCASAAAVTAVVVDAATVVAVAEMMVVVVGFGSSFFCSAAADVAADSAADSAAKQNIKQDPNHLWFGSCLRLTAALTFLLSRPCKSSLIHCTFLSISVLFLFHAFIINFVNCISIYD